MTNVVETSQPADLEHGKQQEQQDVENKATSEDSETAASTNEIEIPTLMDFFWDVNGALGFAIGSSGFVCSMYFDDWLPYFRYGSLVWIYGCVMYSVPLLMKFRAGCSDGCPWGIGDLGEFLCCLGFIIGCVMGGFFGEDTVDNLLMAINHTFLWGSLALTMKPIYYLFLLLRKKFICPSINSSTSSAEKISNMSDLEVSMTKIWYFDKVLEGFAITFYCAAGYFGGFPPHPSLALPGQYFWEVGSLFAVSRSLLMLYKRNTALKAIAMQK